jgi:triphosphoribosyl-dephospho-CoA synthase
MLCMTIPLRPRDLDPLSGSSIIGALAEHALKLEIETWPKPGLVSHVDSGSHADMDAPLLHASARALRPFFSTLAGAGAAGASMDVLRGIGLSAEAVMLQATNGVNAHRGAIFGLGLLCAAAGTFGMSQAIPPGGLGKVVRERWHAAILNGPVLGQSHGADIRHRYRVGGAPAEAASGFPNIYDVGLPALRNARLLSEDPEAARVQACFALIAHIEDTNLLYRGGAEGLRFARQEASIFLQRGGISCSDWRQHAEAIHKAFVGRRLSPGGCADLLAMTLFVDALEAA